MWADQTKPMDPHPAYDVVVAGAGVAGAIAALLLARQGLSVLVADQKPDQDQHKVLCTHFVQPLARSVLRKLGLEAAMEAAGAVPTKAAFWTTAGWIDPPGDYATEGGDGTLLAYNAERRILDPLLMRELAASPRIDLRLRHAVRTPERHADGWKITLEDPGASSSDADQTPSRTVLARLLVAADGRSSALAEALGNTVVTRKENQRACSFAYVEGVQAPERNRSLFMLGGRHMAFLYPLGGARALLSAYVPQQDRIGSTEAEERLAALLAAFDGFPDVPDLSHAVLASRIYGFSNYPNLVRNPVHADAAFVGDAALSLDPMSGVGCAFAIVMADMLADSIAAAAARREDLGAGLPDYAARFAAFFPPHAVGIAADSIIAKSAATTHSVYKRIVDSPRLQKTFIALTGRLVMPSAFQRAYLAEGVGRLRRSA